MKLITRDTDYAIRALGFIAKYKNKIVPASQLVKALKIPRPFLRKLLQRLNREGILKSYKGSGGGFLLARPGNKINIIDLIKIFQGELKLNECLFKKSICPNIKTCVLRKKINNIEKYVISQLKPITIATLLRERR
ncbi:MAG: Rrf2 family transcriptional regulator [Candidatus Omnitrophica bacterium]|nr:Rrf2 family transcriptional regulator [Candidatus Omnitrophota bacterium]